MYQRAFDLLSEGEQACRQLRLCKVKLWIGQQAPLQLALFGEVGLATERRFVQPASSKPVHLENLPVAMYVISGMEITYRADTSRVDGKIDYDLTI